MTKITNNNKVCVSLKFSLVSQFFFLNKIIWKTVFIIIYFIFLGTLASNKIKSLQFHSFQFNSSLFLFLSLLFIVFVDWQSSCPFNNNNKPRLWAFEDDNDSEKEKKKASQTGVWFFVFVFVCIEEEGIAYIHRMWIGIIIITDTAACLPCLSKHCW